MIQSCEAGEPFKTFCSLSLFRSKEDSFKFTMTQLHQRHPSVTKPFQEEFVDVNIKNGFFDAANKMRRQGIPLLLEINQEFGIPTLNEISSTK